MRPKNVAYCRACKRETIWKKAKAFLNGWWVHSDFIGDYSGTDMSRAQRGQTMSQTAPAKMVTVDKCEECGRSITR